MAIQSGSCPAPFSALNGFRLAGPDGSHPLHRVAIPELVMPYSGAVAGEIRIDGPIVVGEAIRGHLLAVAQRDLAMLDTVSLEGGATIGVANAKPVRAGSVVRVTVAWPGAPDGNARIELHRRITAPNGIEGVLDSVATIGAALRAGVTADLGGLAAGSPPSFDGAGLENTYVIRVLIDRRLRSDLAIERPIAVV